MAKRVRIKPTKMWASDDCGVIHRVQYARDMLCLIPVMVLDYRDYLALKRAAKGKR